MKKPRDERMKQIRAPKTTMLLKICPKDDSNNIIDRAQSRKREKEKRFNLIQNQRKKQKKERSRARRKARKITEKAEVDGLESAKHLLTATIDQYTTLLGDNTADTENMNKRSCQSRRKEHPNKQLVRRSSRVATNKANF